MACTNTANETHTQYEAHVLYLEVHFGGWTSSGDEKVVFEDERF
jgi:hypothetical protein